jgi:hypothetical protein
MRYPTALFFALGSLTTMAQNTLRPNLYYNNMNYYNVASSDSDSARAKSLMLYVKKKYIGNDNDVVWSKPANIYLNYIGSIDTKSFLNVSYIYDGYSFYNRHTLYAGYGRGFRLGGSHLLTAGARAVLNFDGMRWDELDQIQDKPSTNLHLTPDVDFGVQYQWKKLIVGISWKNMFSSAYKVDGDPMIQNWKELYINASYTFAFFKGNLLVSPYILYFNERDIEFDAGINFEIGRYVDASYCLRTFELRSIYSARVKVLKSFQVGIAIDHSSVFSDTNLDTLVSYRF